MLRCIVPFRAVEATDVARCIELYDESCKTYEDENKLRFGADTFKRAIGVCLRNKRLVKVNDRRSFFATLLLLIEFQIRQST